MPAARTTLTKAATNHPLNHAEGFWGYNPELKGKFGSCPRTGTHTDQWTSPSFRRIVSGFPVNCATRGESHPLSLALPLSGEEGRKEGARNRDRHELRLIFDRLHRAYGPQHWWPADTAFEVAVGAVLTQNASWSAVERAIIRLKSHRLLSLARLARLSPSELAPLIKPAGLYHVKARRLHGLLKYLTTRGGFAGLRRMRTSTLRTELLAIHGIGQETADSILLYALNRPVFVIDAYTRRVLYRYGLIQGNEPYDVLRHWFQSTLPADTYLFNEYHALLVKLAKTHCRARPLCSGCPLA